jgi:hypothetical protein
MQRGRETQSTGTARLYPKQIGNSAPGYSLDEFIQRSEQMTDVLKHILVFRVPTPKNLK